LSWIKLKYGSLEVHNQSTGLHSNDKCFGPLDLGLIKKGHKKAFQ
jgi:hypothetical protein